MVICHNCKGNGYVKLRFEGETAIEQCKVCHSQGEVKEDEHFYQYWDDGAGSPTIYYGATYILRSKIVNVTISFSNYIFNFM